MTYLGKVEDIANISDNLQPGGIPRNHYFTCLAVCGYSNPS